MRGGGTRNKASTSVATINTPLQCCVWEWIINVLDTVREEKKESSLPDVIILYPPKITG